MDITLNIVQVKNIVYFYVNSNTITVSFGSIYVYIKFIHTCVLSYLRLFEV